jgi:hypothetical protein
VHYLHRVLASSDVGSRSQFASPKFIAYNEKPRSSTSSSSLIEKPRSSASLIEEATKNFGEISATSFNDQENLKKIVCKRRECQQIRELDQGHCSTASSQVRNRPQNAANRVLHFHKSFFQVEIFLKLF